MAKNKQTVNKTEAKAVSTSFSIKYPLLWLIAAVLLVYGGSLQLGFTELDDSIFIRETKSYNEDLSNLATSFHRGVFNETQDNYYRPMFLNSIILNYAISGDNIEGYHFVNLLLHILSVVLLYRLFRKLNLSELTAFLLTLIYAVHPVLTQAVVWIPGRNDTLMACFVLPYLLFSIDYTQTNKRQSLVWAFVFLVAAAFTKETALLSPAVAFVLLVIVLKNSWQSKPMLIQYAVWVAGLALYFIVRSTATLKPAVSGGGQLLHDFVHRLPLIVQYIGKIFLPFNLSVFPIQQDTVYYWGAIALALLIAIIVLAKKRDNRVIIGGALIFFIFLVPVLFVPNNINEQTFEHRLYLPIIGILLMLSQTVVFKNALKEKTLAIIIVAVCAVYALINYNHQQNFKDPLSFWQKAAETSPHSAYAVMMYGARVQDQQEGFALMRRAYALNPNEKYLNYYYGVMLQKQDSLLESEKHFLKEQKISDYYECDFYLAQIDYKKNDKPAAQKHLERYITRDSMNGPANNNLLLLYLETRQKDKAIAHIQSMQRRGMTVPAELTRQATSM